MLAYKLLLLLNSCSLITCFHKLSDLASLHKIHLGERSTSANKKHPKRQGFERSTAMSAAAQTMEQVLFIEVGFGCDQHGQNATKACVR